LTRVPDGQHVVDLLEEYRRGLLATPEAQAVLAHLADCATCRAQNETDAALAAQLGALPVTPASPLLRRRILQVADGRPTGLRRWLRHPAVAALAAAILVTLVLSPWLRFRPEGLPDPVESLLTAGVSEHRRILLQIQGLPGAGEISADPERAFARVYALTDVALPRAFAGGADFRLISARPTLLANRKAAAAVLSSGPTTVTTYFAVPGKDLPMPAERRVQIEQYRPYVREVNGFHCVYWKQGELAYLMVTDLDDSGTRQLFLRMRKAL
jgi:anti-sigma factor RsiW